MNLLNDLISPNLLKRWGAFSHETQVNFIHAKLKEKLAEDPDYEVFVTLKYMKNKMYILPIVEYREFPNVLISNKGRICKTGTGEFYIGTTTANGYRVFTSDGYVMAWHRALAYNFIPKPVRHRDKTYAALEVNHMNGVKLGNFMENLEWLTHEENAKHAQENGLQTVLCGKEHPNVVPMLATVVDIAGYENIQFSVLGKGECESLGLSNKVLYSMRTRTKGVKTYKGCKWEVVTLEDALLHSKELETELIELIKGYTYERTGKKNKGRQKWIYIAKNVETGEEKEYIGSADLVTAGFTYPNVMQCLSGKRKSHKGHTFTKREIE